METLLDYYAKIDSPEFEGITDDDVLALLPHLDSSHSDYNAAAREWMAFKTRKSFDNKDDPAKGTVYGLSWRFAGKDRNAAGEEIDIYEPDVRNLQTDDFEYYEDRYKACSSLFPKTEYGLLVYFGHAGKHGKIDPVGTDEIDPVKTA